MQTNLLEQQMSAMSVDGQSNGAGQLIVVPPIEIIPVQPAPQPAQPVEEQPERPDLKPFSVVKRYTLDELKLYVRSLSLPVNHPTFIGSKAFFDIELYLLPSQRVSILLNILYN